MKARRLVAAGLAAGLLAVAGCGGAGDSGGEGGTPDSLTVWLMEDAKNGWPQVVKAANKEFAKQHPDVNVKIRYQSWDQHLTKFEASLADGDPPDVIELGNTETRKYMVSGALAEITSEKASFDNSKTWLSGLEKSCMLDGKLYCVPYYAAGRAVIYRKDMFKQASIEQTPSSLQEFMKAAEKLNAEFGDNPNFSAIHFPGKYWYYALSFVYDYGGQIAKQANGKWEGALDSPEAITGLKKVKTIVDKYSAASKTATAADQVSVFAEGNTAMMYGLSWQKAVAIDPEAGGNPKLEGKLGVFAMPSHMAEKFMPTFIGGSDLAIPATSDAKKLAMDWVRIYTSTDSQKALVEKGGVLPNTSSLFDLAKDDAVSTAYANALERNWFVPTAANWAAVEQRGVLTTMLVQMLTEKASVEQAAKEASGKVTQILNEE